MEALAEKRVDGRPVAGFNLVAVADGEGVALHWDGTLRAARFGAGAHVISSDRDLDDPSMPEKQLFDRMGPHPDEGAIRAYLASHEGDRPVCKHGDRFGTVSSAIYVAGRKLLFAPGPPCRTPFMELASGGASAAPSPASPGS